MKTYIAFPFLIFFSSSVFADSFDDAAQRVFQNKTNVDVLLNPASWLPTPVFVSS